MFTRDQYELIDFGDGRKLERFGPWVLDRPAPAAAAARLSPGDWAASHARYERSGEATGAWSMSAPLPPGWSIRHGALQLELKPTEFGHLGVFPEQAENWDWIDRAVRAARRPLALLNLFAYTGGSTLAAAAAGAQVTHVDAARNMVDWARRNAQASQLADRPIRWICEDAVKFVRREIKRGRRYDGVILDPPSYGHGPKGEVWKIDAHLRPLLEMCGTLTARQPALALVTCHSPGLAAAELLREVRAALLGKSASKPHAGELALATAAGRRLSSGVVVRWPGEM